MSESGGVLRFPLLTEEELISLDFRRDISEWKKRVRDRFTLPGIRRFENHRSEYFEIHVYCDIPSAAQRLRISGYFLELGLWPLRFEYTYEKVDGEFKRPHASDLREELMLGTHLHVPNALLGSALSDILAVYRKLGLRPLRVRTERPIRNLSSSQEHEQHLRGWWEAHLKVDVSPENIVSLGFCENIRDISVPLDFVSGEKTVTVSYVNAEARDSTYRDFILICKKIKTNLELNLQSPVGIQIERVIADVDLDAMH